MAASVICHLKSMPGSSYSQSRMHFTPEKQKEGGEAYDLRTWREHCHVNEAGKVVIPAEQFRLALADAAEYQSEKIKGKGMATYTKHFGAGIQVVNDVELPYTKETVPEFKGPMHANGDRKSGTRVQRRYPQIPKWSGKVEFLILDPVITQDVFERHVKAAGMFIGIGRYRPRNRGTNGRFICEKIEWKDIEL